MPMNMKMVIAETFAALARQKPIDKITVKALIDQCGISRQTFYYHFQDIMEVIEWSLEQAANNMLEKSLKADSSEEALTVLISATLENKALILKLMGSQKREQIEKLLVRSVCSYFQTLIQEKNQALAVNYTDMEFALDMWAFGLSGMLLKCCTQDHVDARKMAEQICRILPDKLKTE